MRTMKGYRLGQVIESYQRYTCSHDKAQRDRARQANDDAMHLLTCLAPWPTAISLSSYAADQGITLEQASERYRRLASNLNMPVVRDGQMVALDAACANLAQQAALAWMRRNEGVAL